MQPSHHSIPAQEGNLRSSVTACSDTLYSWHQHLAPHFARPEVHQHALLYTQAILSDIPRKNGWQIAEHAHEARPDGMQRLLSQAVWNHDGVRDELRRLVAACLLPASRASTPPHPLFPILVLDESGFPKRGTHSAGVARQYCGRLGQVDNCQVGVFLSLVTERGHALLDRELYLPQHWCDDHARRLAAHIPSSVRFHTKPELALHLLERALHAGLPFHWVVADSVYGRCSPLCHFLEEHHRSYVLGVSSLENVAVQTPTGILLDSVAHLTQQAVGEHAWYRLSQSMGTKGERLFDWALLPRVTQGSVDGRHFLLVRRCLDDPSILAYFLVFAPLDTPLSTIVLAIGARWHIEEDFHACKQLGLDHYEVRSYHGWYRHITLVLLAAAILVAACLPDPDPPPAALRDPPPPPRVDSGSPPLIAMTTAELQHLVARLLFPAPTSLAFVCGWSTFRRAHQYGARLCHRRRRQNQLSATRSP